MNNKKRIISNPFVANAPIMSRVGAVILDVATVVLFWMLASLALSAVLDKTHNYTNLVNQFTLQQVSSKLYYVNEEKTDITSTKISNNDIGEATYLFYTEYMKNYKEVVGEDPKEYYFVNILKVDEPTSFYVRETLPEPQPSPKQDTSSNTSSSSNSTDDEEYKPYVPNGLTLKEDAKIADVLAFERGNFDAASKLFTEYSVYSKYIVASNTYFVWTVFIVILSVLIFYFTIPMLLGNGRTLGKLAVGLLVVNQHGYQIKSLQLIIRAVSAAFIALLLLVVPNGAFIFVALAALFISLTLVVFTKNSRSMHCFLSQSKVIKAKEAIVFKDEQQYKSSSYYTPVSDGEHDQ